MAALIISGVTNIYAQDDDSFSRAEFGFRLMPTFTSLEMRTSTGGSVSGNVILGFGAGAFLGYNFTNHLGIQAELIYSSISQKSYESDVERRVNLRYINIPLLVSLNTGKSKVINLNVVAGPQIGFNVGSSITLTGNNDVNAAQPILSVKKNDIGFAYGAGVDFGLNPAHNLRLGLGYRGVISLLNINDNSNTATTDSYYLLDRSHLKTNAIYFGLSFLF